MGFVADIWGANKAADATTDAAKIATNEQKRQYDLTRSDQMPWMQTGKWALGQLQNAMQGDFSGFYNSPARLLLHQDLQLQSAHQPVLQSHARHSWA